MTTLTDRAKALTALSPADDVLAVIVAIAEQITDHNRRLNSIGEMIGTEVVDESEDQTAAPSEGPETATHRLKFDSNVLAKKPNGKWVLWWCRAWVESGTQSDSDYIPLSQQEGQKPSEPEKKDAGDWVDEFVKVDTLQALSGNKSRSEK